MAASWLYIHNVESWQHNVDNIIHNVTQKKVKNSKYCQRHYEWRRCGWTPKLWNEYLNIFWQSNSHKYKKILCEGNCIGIFNYPNRCGPTKTVINSLKFLCMTKKIFKLDWIIESHDYKYECYVPAILFEYLNLKYF